MKKLPKIIAAIFTISFSLVYPVSKKCQTAYKNEELIALFMGFGSKIIMDTLTRECTFKAFNVPSSQPAHTLDDTHEDTAREVTEEVARTLLSTIIKKNFERILQLAYSSSSSLQETLKKDLALGMSLIPFKNFILVSQDVGSTIMLPSITSHTFIKSTNLSYHHYKFDSLYLTGNERSITQADSLEQLNKNYLFELQNEIPQLTQIKQEVLEKILMGLAPFVGAAFAEISFKIGQEVALQIANQVENHTPYSMAETAQKLIHSTIHVLFLEELKMSFNLLAENLINFPAETEEALYLLTRFGEKLYIVLKVVAPAYHQFYLTVTKHA